MSAEAKGPQTQTSTKRPSGSSGVSLDDDELPEPPMMQMARMDGGGTGLLPVDPPSNERSQSEEATSSRGLFGVGAAGRRPNSGSPDGPQRKAVAVGQ